MDAGVGDRIVVESERAAQPGRAGVIEEVLAHDPPRFRVRWDDERLVDDVRARHVGPR